MLCKITVIKSYGLATLKYLMKKEAKQSWNFNFIKYCFIVYLSFINTGPSTDLSRQEAKN